LDDVVFFNTAEALSLSHQAELICVVANWLIMQFFCMKIRTYKSPEKITNESQKNKNKNAINIIGCKLTAWQSVQKLLQ